MEFQLSCFKSWKTVLLSAALNMPANLENSAVAEFQQAPGDGEGQGSLACCSPWGWKESDMTEQLNNNLYFICQTYTTALETAIVN